MIIYYFSGTGNTKYVVKQLANQLNNKGINTEYQFVSDAKDAKQKINDNDIIFLAYPIYGSDMPEPMKKFIDDMPQVDNKKLGVICTQYLFSGDGGTIMYRKLKKKGYNQMWSYQFNMPNNLCIKGSPFPQTNDYKFIADKYFNKTYKKAADIVEHIKNDKRRVWDNTVFHKLLGLIQRPWYRAFEYTMFTKKMSVDKDLCTNCNLCINICPCNVLDSNGTSAYFKNKKDCTLCMRCLNFCPSDAIKFNNVCKKPLYKGPDKETYLSIIKQK